MHRPEHFLRVARVLISEPDARFFGVDLRQRAGVRLRFMYSVLDELMADGLVIDGWVEPSPDAVIGPLHHRLIRAGIKRPPSRRYYQLSDLGRQQLGELVDTSE